MSEVWQESGAITYVAITVVVFVFIAMCVVWFITKNPNPQYTSVGKTSNEDIVLADTLFVMILNNDPSKSMPGFDKFKVKEHYLFYPHHRSRCRHNLGIHHTLVYNACNPTQHT